MNYYYIDSMGDLWRPCADGSGWEYQVRISGRKEWHREWILAGTGNFPYDHWEPVIVNLEQVFG